MKPISTILLLIILFSCSTSKNHRTTNVKLQSDKELADYLSKTFIDNRAQFVNKNLGNVFEKMTIPIKKYILVTDDRDEFVIAIIFSSYSESEYISRMNKNLPLETLTVSLQKPIPSSQAVALRKKNNGAWTKEEETFYGKEIVKNLFIPDQPK